MSVNILLRGRIAHTPGDPFRSSRAFVTFDDGGIWIRDGIIEACCDYADVRAQAGEAVVVDRRDGFLLPGFVDTHVHFPQVHVIGRLGRELLDWLDHVALPEEARMAEEPHARATAVRFVDALLAHGTTSALAFGAHFTPATAGLFDEALRRGLRLTSGLVMADRGLRPDLHQTPAEAYDSCRHLIAAYHGRGRVRYAVTPRFGLSTSEQMFEVCQTLIREHPDVHVQTHLNESQAEIEACASLFPWADDYLGVYERYGLLGPRSVFAHNVHPSDRELQRLAAASSTVAHCPCSNAVLGSGIFPLKRHLAAGVHVALGTDVGAGIGFSVFKEALQAHLMQRVSSDGVLLGPAHLLYLATRAGAIALGLGDQLGDLRAGRAADLVYLKPPAGSALEAAIARAESFDDALSALFTLGEASAIGEVRIGGDVAFARAGGTAAQGPTGA